MSYLYLFQIGPVQSFIAQARRTQDLLVGSKMLSWLSGVGIQAAQRAPGFQPIFPAQLRPDAPHKFAFLSAGAPPELPQQVQQAIEAAWLSDFAEPIREYLREALGEGAWLSVYDRQKTGWLECYWVAVEHKGSYAEDYSKLNRALSQRKQLRHFPQVEEEGRKCTLTGAQSALPLNWDKLRQQLHDHDCILLRRNENLGTLSLVKRLAPHVQRVPPKFRQLIENFPSTRAIAADKPGLQDDETIESEGKDVRGYLAILHMDGDRMGAALSQLKTLEEHKAFSRALGDFSVSVGGLVRKHGGQTGSLIYAGGDDVLALLPLSRVLDCADAIRKTFYEAMSSFGSEYGSPTMSAGIAITPYDLPLDVGLELARQADEYAKEGYGRDAVVFTETHGVQMHSAGAKWDQVMGMMRQAQTLFHEHRLSAKIAYELQTIAHDMGGDAPKNPHLTEARAAELRRLIKRRTAEGQSPIPDVFAQSIIAFAEAEEHTWSDAANWLILARFLATGGRTKHETRTSEEAQS